METMYTALEVAEMLKVAPRTLANWRFLDKGPAYINVGGLIRYPESALEQYLEAAKAVR